MDTTTLKQNFEKQLSDLEDQIVKLQEELAKAKEYKFKLQGGLETLELLSKEPEEIPTPEIDDEDLDK